ncbi:MAG TPA: hypothetical protein VLK84_23255 [Longimicrobium sp.]|nr:hypothetical protein [Longimicrobium sp.]
MQHLDLETLARLVDEAPEPAEAAHLRDCLPCRRELAELREQTLALAGLGEMEPPAGAWAALEARLVEEKLVRAPAPAGSMRVLGLYRPQVRIAAGLALFLLGGAAGAALWRDGGDGQVAMDVLPVAGAVSPGAANPAAAPQGLADSRMLPVRMPDAASAISAEPMASGEPMQTAVVAETPANANGARLAMNGAAPAESRPAAAVPPRRTAPRRATPAEANQAARELVQAQADYVGALQRVAAIADPASGNPPETRLAALDQLVQLTAAALERVPGDPVVNGYHLAAVAERDALRRQLDRDATAEWF